MTRADRRDEGLTLIELLVAFSMGVLVLIIVGSVMISSLTTQQQVTDTAQATSQAQLTVQQLEREVFAASHTHVQTDASTGSQVLIARVRTGDGGTDWGCAAWYFDADAGVILHTAYDGESTWPWGDSLLNWIDLGSGIIGGTSTPAEWTVLAVGISNETGPGGAAAPVFQQDGAKGVTMEFAVAAGESTPVILRTTVAGRHEASTGDPQCY